MFTSEKANCINFDRESEMFSDILFVTSRRARIKSPLESDEPPIELQEIHDRLKEIETCEANGLLNESIADVSVAHIANMIELRMISSKRYCDDCIKAFNENDKLQNCFVGRNFNQKPCISTYKICKETDRFFKVQFLKQKRYFNAAYYAIAQRLNIKSLYANTDFSHNLNHKLCLIEMVINAYIQIKGTYIARQANFTREQENLRAKLHKLIHFYGQ